MDLRRMAVHVSACAMIFLTSLPVASSVYAADSVIGTVRFSGPAWVGTAKSPYTRIGATRPLLSGDRLKTGRDGYMIADLGAHGAIVLHSDAEISSTGTVPAFAAERGKVAFHLASNSPVQIQANGTEIAATAAATDGYVEYDERGQATVVVENGRVMLHTATSRSSLDSGDSVTIAPAAAADGPLLVAAADEDSEPISDRKASAAPAMQGPEDHSKRNRYLIIGGVSAAAIGGIVAATSSGGGGGGGDKDPSGGLEY